MTMLCVALLIAHTGFQPVEYRETLNALKNAGIAVRTLSNKPGYATDIDGNTVKVDEVIDNYDIETCRGFFIIGGPGTLENLDTPIVHEKLKKIRKAGIALGGICLGPRVAINAGVCKGIKITGWDGDGVLDDLAEAGGAKYVRSESVVRDGNIVTASGPKAAKKFGEMIVKVLLR